MTEAEARSIIERFEAELGSPAAERNGGPLCDALATRLPTEGVVLEVACGALQHALALSAAHRLLSWQPTDIDERVLQRGPAYLDALALLGRRPAGLQALVRLNVCENPWPIETADVIYGANLLHISPETSIAGLLRGAATILTNEGKLLLYGPFRQQSRFTSAGDAAFDESLRARNPAWGIRDLETIVAVARGHALELTEQLAMPANNWLLTFQRRKPSSNR